jgi:DNA-binding response OmpR family regulator
VASEENKIRVLIVDDDLEIQNLARTLLERVGIEALAAHNVAEAVSILRGTPMPTVVVLDLMLPDINGLELLRQMRAKSVFDHIPVIILSALADPNQIKQGLELGADRYLTKPYIAHNLLKTVQDVLRTGRRIKAD